MSKKKILLTMLACFAAVTLSACGKEEVDPGKPFGYMQKDGKVVYLLHFDDNANLFTSSKSKLSVSGDLQITHIDGLKSETETIPVEATLDKKTKKFELSIDTPTKTTFDRTIGVITSAKLTKETLTVSYIEAIKQNDGILSILSSNPKQTIELVYVTDLFYNGKVDEMASKEKKKFKDSVLSDTKKIRALLPQIETQLETLQDEKDDVVDDLSSKVSEVKLKTEKFNSAVSDYLTAPPEKKPSSLEEAKALYLTLEVEQKHLNDQLIALDETISKVDKLNGNIDRLKAFYEKANEYQQANESFIEAKKLSYQYFIEYDQMKVSLENTYKTENESFTLLKNTIAASRAKLP